MRYLLLLTIFFSFCSEQKDEDSLYNDLRQNANLERIRFSDTMRDLLVGGGRGVDIATPYLNYTIPLLKGWKLLQQSDCLSDGFKDLLSQSLCFVGDVKSIYNLSFKDPGDSVVSEKFFNKHFNAMKLKARDAKDVVLEQFKSNSIVMLNEAHDRALTRTFLLSILKDLKQVGVTCLALETLNSMGNLKELDYTTGNYTNEPVFGQVIREALRLGFRLIPYEITDDQSKINMDRELAQAINLFKNIKSSDEKNIEKTIVLAGYGHIDEESYGSDYQMMARCFKQISKIDPITISQLTFMECFGYTSIARKLFEKKFHPQISVAISSEDGRPFMLHFLIEDSAYLNHKMANDFFIYQPGTKFIHNRPDWLLSSKDKEFISVEIPTNIKPVLVQAYVAEEIKSDKDYATRVPYDQTFSSENGKAWLALKKGDTYWLVFRGEDNGILLKKEIKG